MILKDNIWASSTALSFTGKCLTTKCDSFPEIYVKHLEELLSQPTQCETLNLKCFDIGLLSYQGFKMILIAKMASFKMADDI